MLASDIPPDVWTAISSYVVHPKYHITLSQICQSSRSIHTGEDTWKLLCRSIGIGRGTQEKAVSWKKVFMEVVAHRDRCRLPQCYEYGVPPMKVTGDLLPSSQAALEHYEYFKRKEAEKAKTCSCPCGHKHTSDDSIMDLFAHAMGFCRDDDGDDEEDHSDSDEEEEGHGHNFTIGGTNTAPTLPASMSPLAQMFASFGLAAGPMGSMAIDLATGLPTHSAPQAAVGTSPTPTIPKPKKKTTRPSIEPRLLPLSLKHESRVPSRPHLHCHLAELGNVYFKLFLEGGIALNNGYVRLQYGREQPATSRGMDWDDQDENQAHMLSVGLKEHPLLARAFATNPPVTELVVTIETLQLKVVNKDGVTVQDVIYHLHKFLSKRVTLKDHQESCPCHPPMVSCMDIESRFVYLMNQFGASEDSNARVGYEDCFLRGVVNFSETTGVTSMMLLPQ